MKHQPLRWDTPLWKMNPITRMLLIGGSLVVLGTIGYIVWDEYRSQVIDRNADKAISDSAAERQRLEIELRRGK